MVREAESPDGLTPGQAKGAQMTDSMFTEAFSTSGTETEAPASGHGLDST